jgi:hypothetical protein
MTAEINQGIRILLERMKSNPEEFEIDQVKGADRFYLARWDFINRAISKDSWATDEERKLLITGINRAQAEAFTRQVMATLLRYEEPEPDNSSGTYVDNSFNTHKSNAINTKEIVKSQLLSLRQHLDANNSNSGNYHGSKK